MGILDGLGDQVAKHSDKVDDAVEKGGDFVDSKTDSKYAEHVDKGQDFLSDKYGSASQADEPSSGERS